MTQSPQETIAFLFLNIIEIYASRADKHFVILEVNALFNVFEACGTSSTLIEKVRGVARLLLRWQIGFASAWGWDGYIHDVGELVIGSAQARVCSILIICPRAGPKGFVPVWCIFEIAFWTWGEPCCHHRSWYYPAR